MSFKICAMILMCLASFRLTAQEAQGQIKEEDKVTLERADILEKTPDKPNVKKLIRRVVIRHKGTVLYCDSAYQYESKNSVVTFGNVQLQGEDGTRLSADSMSYDGNTQVARAIGKRVVLIDEKMQLTTKALDYDMASGVAYYYNGGEIVDSEKTLTSATGSYDTNSKIFYFKKDVELISKKDGQKINTDDLTYNTISKLAFFQGPTKIKAKDGDIYTEKGTYNTETQVSNFTGRTNVQDDNYYLAGDTVYFENSQKIGYAQGNVEMRSKKDSIIVFGDFGWFRGKEGESKIYGDCLMLNISNNDTLFVKADTMYSISTQDKTKRLLLAYPNTKIYRKDLQGKCDSLAYNRNDSTIRFFEDPVLWNEGSQMLADSIWIQMANNKIDRMHLRNKAFLIQQDSLKRFNQLKGKNMEAFFRRNQIQKMEIRGNSQNIYFVVEKDTLLTGMNRVDCSDMNVRFLENNKLSRITYINQAEASFIPPHELVEPQTKLKDFKWRIAEKPKRKDMVRQNSIIVRLEKKGE